MKIKIDFETNSSSANFTISLKKDKRDVLLKMFDDFIDEDKDSLLAELKEELESINKSIEERNKHPSKKMDAFFDELDDGHKDSILMRIAELEKIKEREEFIEFYINYRGLNIEEEDEKTKISGGVSMFNSVNDLPELFRLLITHLVVHDIDYKLKFEDDGNDRF